MVKEVKHYVSEVQKKFPFLSEQEINKILTYGLKRYLWVNKMHCDVLICNRIGEAINAFCGRLWIDVYKHYLNWVSKFRMKERVLWRLNRVKWDGFYYIGLDDTDHAKIVHQGKVKKFKNVYLTKIKKELYHNKIVKHIWRVQWPTDCGWKFFLNKLTIKAEYVGPNQYEVYHDCFLGKYKDGGISS